MMVYRIYVEKASRIRGGGQGHFVGDPSSAAHQKRDGPAPAEPLRRGGHRRRAVFDQCCGTVFCPSRSWTSPMTAVPEGADAVFATEFLPGQFDQRAASAAECIQLVSQGERPDGAAPPACILLYGAPTRRGAGCNQKIRHQPRGELGRPSLAEKATLQTALRHPNHRGNTGGLHRAGRGRPCGFCEAATAWPWTRTTSPSARAISKASIGTPRSPRSA